MLFHLRLTVFAALATITCADGALLLTTFPLASGVDVHPSPWQVDTIFFGLLALTALMVGAFAIVLTSLAATVIDVLRNLPQEVVEDILAEDEAPPAPDLDRPATTGR